jgi:imidazolonepropionase-like amidohydrolase
VIRPDASLRIAAALFATTVAAALVAAPRSVPTTQAHALVGGLVIVSPGRELPGATIVIRDGIIEAVGTSVAIPPDARRWDVSGMVLWPGLVDAHLGLSRFNGLAGPKTADGSDAPAAAPAPTVLQARRSAAGSENPLVHPEVRVADLLAPDAKAIEAMLSQGFAAACVVPDRGILRGRDAVVSLRPGTPGELIVAEGQDLHAAFEARDSGYPDSVMGSTAVLRQSMLDGDWYRRARAATAKGPTRIDEDAALEAVASFLSQPARSRGRIAVACKDVLDCLRAGALASEFGLPLRLKGAGDEYRRLADVSALGSSIILPVAYPGAPGAVDEAEWGEVSIEQLRHFDRAPNNARWLAEAGVEVSLSTDGLENPKDFTARVRRSIEAGLAPDLALAMTTIHPARLLGLSDRLGTIEKGRLANVVVARGRPFGKATEVRDVWVDGRRHVVSREPQGPLGEWKGTITDGGTTHRGKLSLSVKGGAFTWDPAEGVKDDKAEQKKASASNVVVDADHVTFELAGTPLEREGTLKLAGSVDRSSFSASTGDRAVAIQAERFYDSDPGAAEKRTPAGPPPAVGGALSSSADVLFVNATAWTCGPMGIATNADILVRGGRIAAIGTGLTRPAGIPVVDCAGRHVTPGLLDAHNHSAIVGGVNEGTNSCTAEVRIGDVVNSETIDIYRQLAGGTTTVNLLHGSANCMGGQSQVIKLRWGAAPEALKFSEAKPAIKFALGENVKQSNWGEKYTTRYPQTRMGVEQFMREKFSQARDWGVAASARARPGGLPPRRDLQLETLAEILRGERSVHCHSYRQDEILMLMRVAEDFGFRIGTFQHILEGYKVADEMAKHGVMASSFTDWWAYKFEVYDAIPHNPALMRDRGVIVSVNSDSTELARRMNLEAAKVAKWGNVPREEALHFVTINAARQLGVESVTGSLEPGKAADIVVWSGDPLSTATRVEKTYVDGLLYFDRELDVAGRAALATERAGLIASARKARDGDGASGEPWRPSYLENNAGCMDGIEGAAE